MKGGKPLLAEVIIKNWASHYFRRDMQVSSVSNQAGFDIISLDKEIAIEVKTCWKPDKNYVNYQSIDQKKDKEGNYIFRSTNNGISAFVNPKGQIIKQISQKGYFAVSYTHLTLPTKRIV